MPACTTFNTKTNEEILPRTTLTNTNLLYEVSLLFVSFGLVRGKNSSFFFWTGAGFSIKIVVEMKRRVLAILLALLAVPSWLAAQDGEQPHISRISAESRSNLIRLRWVDSPDAQGPVFIFKSTRPFSGTIPANIRPVVVRYGQQYYIDDADDINNLFYFIAASDVSGQRFDVIIPRTNTANVNLSAAPDSQTPAAVAETPSPAPVPAEPAQGIINLRARQDEKSVVVTFDVSGDKKNAVIYRSARQMRVPADLLNAVIVQTGADSSFVDFPVPGAWFYAAVIEDDISSGSVGVAPGVNATTSPVTIPGAAPTPAAVAPQTTPQAVPLRPIPLPVMSLRNATSDGVFLPGVTELIPLSEESASMLRDAQLPPKAPLAKRSPQVFTVDLRAPVNGEESALFQIVNDFFAKRDWEEARDSLQRYLSLPRSQDAQARARFYLGQTFYFTESYKEALFEFLSIKSLYPAESNVWIDAILTAMVH